MPVMASAYWFSRHRVRHQVRHIHLRVHLRVHLRRESTMRASNEAHGQKSIPAFRYCDLMSRTGSFGSRRPGVSSFSDFESERERRRREVGITSRMVERCNQVTQRAFPMAVSGISDWENGSDKIKSDTVRHLIRVRN